MCGSWLGQFTQSGIRWPTFMNEWSVKYKRTWELVRVRRQLVSSVRFRHQMSVFSCARHALVSGSAIENIRFVLQRGHWLSGSSGDGAQWITVGSVQVRFCDGIHMCSIKATMEMWVVICICTSSTTGDLRWGTRCSQRKRTAKIFNSYHLLQEPRFLHLR